MLNGQLPIFTSQDNPAAFAPNVRTRFLSFAYLSAFSLCMLFLPSKLSYDWQMNSIELVEQWTDPRNLTTLVVFVLLTCLVLAALLNRNKATQSMLYFGVTFLIITHLPASNLLVTVGFVVAERTLYVPSIGFSTLLLVGYLQLVNRLNGQAHGSSWWWPRKERIEQSLKLAIGLLFAVFFVKTLLRNQDWLTRESLFE